MQLEPQHPSSVTSLSVDIAGSCSFPTTTMQTVSESTPCRGSRTYVTWSLAGQAAILTDLRAKLIEDMAHAAVGLGKTFIDQVLAIPEDVDLSQCPPPRASKNPFTRLAKAQEKSESEIAAEMVSDCDSCWWLQLTTRRLELLGLTALLLAWLLWNVKMLLIQPLSTTSVRRSTPRCLPKSSRQTMILLTGPINSCPSNTRDITPVAIPSTTGN